MYPMGLEHKFIPDELHFTRTNGLMDELIDQLLGFAGGVHCQDVVREMIIAALKAGQESDDRADLKLMTSTLKEMRFTSKVFSPYKEFRKVSVFGSARTTPDKPVYRMASLLGQHLADAGYMVITGGGPGIMQAVNEGAGLDHSFGVSIRLPFEQKSNPVCEGNPRNINYKYFFNRKIAFLKESDAVVLFPGGFGTMDEAFETLTLIQTGKRNPMPLLLMEEPEGAYWRDWMHFLKHTLAPKGLISETDFNLIQVVDSSEKAVGIINRFYRRYHSLRYVDQCLVIRLLDPLSPERVRAIKAQFQDMLRPGGDLYLAGALDEELDEPELKHLPRLVLDFKRHNFGRLRSLIDVINQE